MKLRLIALAAAIATTAGQALGQVVEVPPGLVFLPPSIERQALCTPAAARSPAPAPKPGLPAQEGLEEAQLIAFLKRDIAAFRDRDAAGKFDFIADLIEWRARIDEDYAGIDETFDRIELFLDAGRGDELQEAGLIADLRARVDELDSGQRLELAQYYLQGLGVAPDPAFGWSLVREAALAGHPGALLMIARALAEGTAVPDWSQPYDVTVTLAIGGMLGQLDRGVCRRAQTIAEMFETGDLVPRNPQVAHLWHRFAADLSSPQAAWRVVEYQLGAPTPDKDDRELLDYLALGVQNGLVLRSAEVAALRGAGIDETTILAILGPNHAGDIWATRRSLAGLLKLDVRVDAMEVSRGGPYLDYLRQLVQVPTTPGEVFTRLASEVLDRKGRWKGADEARGLLEEAIRRGDPEAVERLGRLILAVARDDADRSRGIDLLIEAAERHGRASAMGVLDATFRCRLPDSPRAAEADIWARSYRASHAGSVRVSAGDLLKLDPFREPETIAEIQSQALQGRPGSLAKHALRVQSDPYAGSYALEIWADRLDSSDKALEEFASLEFQTARNPAERRRAIELFRRAYLNNGVSTAFELALALLEDGGRDPQTAEEVLALLTMAGNRGKGAAMRLKARLTGDEDSVYAEFAEVIEERGDFLALVFAIPHVAPDRAEDYFRRAAAVMDCTTRDIDELGEVAARIGDRERSYHWRRVALALPGGNSLSKLRLSDRQMEAFGRGAAPDAVETLSRLSGEGAPGARRALYRLTADPALPTWDPAAAAGHLTAMLSEGDDADSDYALRQLRTAPREVREALAEELDMKAFLTAAAARGDATAGFELALMLRRAARSDADLAEATEWIERAAKAGLVPAMREIGKARTFGLGVQRDVGAGREWLRLAAEAGDREAQELLGLIAPKGLSQ